MSLPLGNGVPLMNFQGNRAPAPAYASNSAPSNSSVYWVGADGNVYLKDGNGVRNMGKGIAGSAAGFDAKNGSAQAKQIADPNPPQQGQQQQQYAPNNNVGGGGSGSGGVVYPDLSGAINILRQNISALDPIYNANVANANQAYDTANNERISKYNTTKAASDQSGISNDQNVLQSRNAINKNTRQTADSTSSLLDSMGMGGSSTNKALSTIADKSNSDLNTANYGYGKNKQNILQSWNDYVNQDANQQKQLTDSKNYNIAQAGIQRDTAKKDALSQIASNQIQMGQGTGDVLGQIAGVNSDIAGLSQVHNTFNGITPTYTAPSIGSILGPNQPAYAVSAGSPVPGAAPGTAAQGTAPAIAGTGAGTSPSIVKVNPQQDAGSNNKYGITS